MQGSCTEEQQTSSADELGFSRPEFCQNKNRTILAKLMKEIDYKRKNQSTVKIRTVKTLNW